MIRFVTLVFLAIIINCNSYAQELKTDSISLYFPFNSCSVFATDTSNLKAFLFQQDIKTISVAGYTDTVGSNRYNQKLSLKRANAVAKIIGIFLQDQEPDITAYGETIVVSNEQQYLNRRVVVTITILVEASTIVPDTIIEKKPLEPEPKLIRVDTAVHIKQKLQVKNVFFYPNQPSVLPSSQSYLRELAKTLLRFSPDANFEIRGYVNCPECKDKINLDTTNGLYRLSQERAKEVYMHLISLGVPAERMRYIGLGWLNMLYPNAMTEAEMKKNMRVEVAVF